MKSSLFLTASGAMLAMASPIEKRIYQTTTVWDMVTVTVTAGQQPSGGAFLEHPHNNNGAHYHHHSEESQHSTTQAAKPTQSSQPVVIVTKVVGSASKEHTEAAPPPQPTTTQSAPVVVVPAPSPPKDSATPTNSASSGNSGSTGGSGGSASDSYPDVMVGHHNMHRANHSSPDIEWDDNLARLAGIVSDSCVYGHVLDLEGVNYGQNIANWGVSNMKNDDNTMKYAGAAAVTDQWYDGEYNVMAPYFGLDTPPAPAENAPEWGHLTQLVWADSNKVGCKTSFCPRTTPDGLDTYYTVCNYVNRGNQGGQYAKNVKVGGNQASSKVTYSQYNVDL